jgi:uncharacterized membrane protein SpoIIM required for sporulation
MRQAPFEQAHAAEWNALERFLDKGDGFDPAELPARYRRLCQQLALAADRQYSAALVDRLNRLALQGHHALYRTQRRPNQRVLEFLLAGFPALVRAEWRLVSASALLFFAPLGALIGALQVYPDLIHYLLAPEQIAGFHEMYDPASERLGMREADTNLMMFGFYIWNNVRIGFQTFAGGMLFGIGSVWFLVANGVVIGAVAGYLTQIGYHQTFWSFVAGHSSFELVAIVLSGAAGLRLAAALVAPGQRLRKAALVAAARPAVRIMYGAALLFVVAALVEAFWSPLTGPAFEVKIVAGFAGWALLLAYLAFAGRPRAAR